MTRILAILLSIILSAGLYGQTDTTIVKVGKKQIVKVVEGDDSIIVSVGKKGIKVVDSSNGTSVDLVTSDECDDSDDEDKIKRPGRHFDGHWKGLGIGMNSYVTSDYSFSLPANARFMELNTGKSWGVDINFLQYDIGIGTDKIGLVTGMGFQFNDYRFDGQNSITKDPDTREIVSLEYDAETIIDKSKLSTTYLTVPFLLEFQIPVSGRKNLFLSGGVIGGLKIGSHTKVIYKHNGNKQKDKIRNDFNLSPVRYGVTARIGYRALKIFANYNITPLFEKGEGPELYPVSIGLILFGF